MRPVIITDRRENNMADNKDQPAQDYAFRPPGCLDKVPESCKDMKVVITTAEDAKYVPGRRKFFKYRDLGAVEGSGGRMRAFQNASIEDMVESTGWHYHLCEMQFVYVLKGELIIEFEDGTAGHFGAGDSFYLPGGVRHNEVYVSADKDSVEVSLPGVIGTVMVERPAHLPEKLRPVGNLKVIGRSFTEDQKKKQAANG